MMLDASAERVRGESRKQALAHALGGGVKHHTDRVQDLLAVARRELARQDELKNVSKVVHCF
jgi:hypothetical protein